MSEPMPGVAESVEELAGVHREIQAAEGETLLETRDLTVKFGGLVALDSVSFNIRRGEILGLIGPNGAGKTTCFNAITGVYRASSGSVIFDGAPLGRIKRHQITRRGIARTFQNIRLFGEMTALENVMVGTDARHKTSVPGAWCVLEGTDARNDRPSNVPRRCSISSGSLIAGRRRRRICRMATSAASRSPGRWRPNLNCCASTNRPPGSIRPRRRR
ncbi:ABC transporter ATP-binding protein [Mycolicibacterium conceptionense]|uniref:ABC transporter ATP-binding protein n=1 Tax=Mycolicibacterium conceptionense TaxID=451644 RepID=A0A0U1DNM8_9MYCO|nr:ABC transporter ATP-binding protein [Mycolicibacterium conceptionense]